MNDKTTIPHKAGVAKAVKAVPLAARPGVLSLTIKDKNALYAAYMPFVKGGGIFVPNHIAVAEDGRTADVWCGG